MLCVVLHPTFPGLPFVVLTKKGLLCLQGARPQKAISCNNLGLVLNDRGVFPHFAVLPSLTKIEDRNFAKNAASACLTRAIPSKMLTEGVGRQGTRIRRLENQTCDYLIPK
jgi:hypothetical protein